MNWLLAADIVVGLLLAVLLGSPAARITRDRLWCMADAVPAALAYESDRATILQGMLERLVIALIAAFKPQYAVIFAVSWMGLKLASSWNMAGRPNERHTPRSDRELRHNQLEWEKRRRSTMVSMSASLVSASFGVAGGMIIHYRFVTELLALARSEFLNTPLT